MLMEAINTLVPEEAEENWLPDTDQVEHAMSLALFASVKLKKLPGGVEAHARCLLAVREEMKRRGMET